MKVAVERKRIGNGLFYYLTKRVKVDTKYSKISVYLGKTVPKDFTASMQKLEEKEIERVNRSLSTFTKGCVHEEKECITAVEVVRIRYTYLFANMTEKKKELFWRRFAIRFIYESNSIEGSRLSEDEVRSIVTNTRVKKNLDRKEVQEAINSILCFNTIVQGLFTLNQKEIVQLHKTLVTGLSTPTGFKKEKIIVNNKETVAPDFVRSELTKLIAWWKVQQKRKKNAFVTAVQFHQRFEKIHPFTDGNGRIGRLILIWMLQRNDYGVLLIKIQNRQRYMNSLSEADDGREKRWLRFATQTYKETYNTLSQMSI